MLAQAATPRTMAAAANGNHRLTVIACDSYRFRPASHAPGGGPAAPTKLARRAVGDYPLSAGIGASDGVPTALSSARMARISRKIFTITAGDESVETPRVRGK